MGQVSQEARDRRSAPGKTLTLDRRTQGDVRAARPGRPRVVIGIRDLGFHQEVFDFLERDPRLEVVGAATDAQAMLRWLGDGEPEAAVVCPGLVTEVMHPVARRHLPPLVVVTEEITVPVLRDAIDASARAVFAWPTEREELAHTLARIEGGERRDAAPRGAIIAVFGARGGAGTTFVASHLAASFADTRLTTVLVDLDVDFAGLTVALGIEPDAASRTVADLVPVAEELGPDHVDDALYRHPRGFDALLAPQEEAPDPIPTGLYRGAIALLATAYQMVVLHAPRVLDEVVRAGVGMADRVLLVTTQDLFSVYGARRAMVTLGLSQTPHRCRVVINRLSRAEVTTADIARILGVRPAASVRPDSAVQRAQDRGQLLPPRARRAGRDLRALAGTFARDLEPILQGGRQ
jgi:Flp pilus assembly CpaE family ATPase